MKFCFLYLFIPAAFFLGTQQNVQAQSATDTVQVRIRHLRNNVYMIDCPNGFGGGNVLMSTGENGVLLVDNLFRSMVPKMLTAIKQYSDSTVKYIINTHYHPDHMAGNVVLGKAATTIGHQQLRNRIIAPPNVALPKGLLPVITFSDTLTVYLNNDTVRLRHFSNAHTDTDITVHFKSADIIHLGDMFFAGMFPGVYKEGGGDIRNLINQLEIINEQLTSESIVIPGHGEPANKSAFGNYITMLKETVGAAEDCIGRGLNIDALLAHKSFAKHAYLGEGGGQSAQQYAEMLFKLLKK
jgi:cyclase